MATGRSCHMAISTKITKNEWCITAMAITDSYNIQHINLYTMIEKVMQLGYCYQRADERLMRGMATLPKVTRSY